MVGPVLGSGDTTKNSDSIISAFRAENLLSSGEKRQHDDTHREDGQWPGHGGGAQAGLGILTAGARL